MVVRCRSCPDLDFTSVSLRDAHTRRKHQSHCKITQAGGKVVIVRVLPSGEWACFYPSCPKRYPRADRLQEHYKANHNPIMGDEGGPHDHADPVSIHESVLPNSAHVPSGLGDVTEPGLVSRESSEEPGGEAVPPDSREVCTRPHEDEDEDEDEDEFEYEDEETERESSPNRSHTGTTSWVETNSPEVLSSAELSVVRYGTMSLLLCHSCACIVDGSRVQTVLNHVDRHSRGHYRPGERVRPEFKHELSNAIETLQLTPLKEAQNFFYNQPGLLVPVAGLPVAAGHSCSGCNYHVVSFRTMRNHLSSCPGEGVSIIKSGTPLQRLGRFLSKYFPVSASTSDQSRSNSDMKEAILSSIRAFEQPQLPRGDLTPRREVSSFIRCSSWDTYAHELIPEGTIFADVKNAIVLQRGDKSLYSRLPEVVRSYGQLARETVPKMDFFIRAAVRGPDGATEGFHKFMLDKTADKYCGVLIEFFLALLRSRAREYENGAPKFIHVVRHPEYLGPKIDRLQDQLRDVGSGAIASDDFDHTIVHELLLGLWTPPRDDTVVARNATENVFLQFMILHTLKPGAGSTETYSWKDTAQVTQMLSMLKHWGRTCVEMEIGRKLWDKSARDNMLLSLGNFYLDYVNERPANLLWETPFMLVSSTQKLACTIVGTEPVRPHLISECPFHSWCIIDGHHVTLQAYRDTVLAVIQDCTILMREEVLQAMDTTWMQPLLEPGHHIVDELNNKTLGYSFMTDPRNAFEQHKHDLQLHLFSRGVSSNHFIRELNGKSICWNNKFLESWEASANKLFDRLNLLMHVTGVGVPRMAEYGSLVVRNTNTKERSFFWSNETLAIFQDYNKTLWSKNPVKLIVRFLPLCLRLLFLQYMCLVRPALAFVAGVLRGKVAGTLYEDVWFVGKRGRLSPQVLSKGLRREFTNHCQAPLTGRQVRHTSKFFSAKVRAVNKALRLQEKPVDASSGHSQRTGCDLYAQNAVDPRFVSMMTWQNFLHMSRAFHAETLSLPRDLNSPSAGPSAAAGGLKRPADLPTTLRPCPEVELNIWPEPNSKRVRVDHHCGYGSRALDADELYGIEPDSVYLAKHALVGLKHEDWKTPEQATAVAMALDNTRDFFAILPTGAGKSVIFKAAAHSSGKTVVVVVPLKMLIKGHLADAKKTGIGAVEYKGKDNFSASSAPGLVFVSVEIAVSDTFRAWVKSLCALGALHSIVIDEVHLVLCPFRPKMRELRPLSGVQCQLIGLTASLEPKNEICLGSILGRHDIKVIRASTVRPNLKYEVKEATDIKSMDDEIVCTLYAWQTLAKAEGWAEGRVLIYCMTRVEVIEMSALLEKAGLRCTFLHSNLEEADKVSRLEAWERGDMTMLVTTSLLGCGYDFPTVRLVIHRGSFYALHDFHQQSGRCSRDGEPGECVVVSCAKYREHACARDNTDDVKAGLQQANDWISQTTVCRRWNLHKELDGKAAVCSLVVRGVSCDVCSVRGCHVRPKPKGRGSQQWGSHHQSKSDFSEPAGYGDQLQFQARPEAVQLDVTRERDIADLLFVRNHAGGIKGDRCLICSTPSSYAIHPVEMCKSITGRCFRCLGERHLASSCPNKKKPEGQQTCHKCFMQMIVCGETRFHVISPGDPKDCKDKSGDRIRQFLWYTFLDRDALTHARRHFNSMPTDRGKFEGWLLELEHGRFLNNFGRLAAVMMRYRDFED